MAEQRVAEINASPQDCLRALQKSVGARFDWRIMTGGKTDAPRFVIEKRVKYSVARRMAIHSTFRVVGNFAPTDNSETQLTYAVSGQPGVALLTGGITVTILPIFAFAIANLVLDPSMRGGLPLGLLLVAILLAGAAGYVYLSRRGYMAHLRELQTFMEAFAVG